MKAFRISLLPPVEPWAYARRRREPLPWPLDQPECRLYARARHALYCGARAAGLGPADTVLVPAYHHGSEIESLLRIGLTLRYYDVGDDLAPDPDALDALRDDSTRALHLSHSLGRPQDAAFWRTWCDERGLLLVEDAAQAWLGTVGGRPVGAWGDVAVFCLYKTIGVPDGGALAGPAVAAPQGRRPRAARALLHRHRAWSVGRAPAWLPAGRHRYDPSDYDVGLDFGLGDPGTPASAATGMLVGRVAAHDAAAARRRAYARLGSALDDLVPAALRTIASGASPFVFPIATRDKDRVVAGLWREGIEALSLWSVPHPSLPEGSSPVASRLRRELVGLPVHQGLSERDLAYVAASARRHARR